MPEWVREWPGGCAISVRVTPRSPRPGVSVGAESLAVRVRAPALEGRATREALQRLAGALGVAPSRVRLRSGPRSRTKVYVVEGLSPEQAARRLEAG